MAPMVWRHAAVIRFPFPLDIREMSHSRSWPVKAHLAAGALALFSLVSNAQSQEQTAPARAPLPVENFTQENWVGQYMADKLPEDFYQMFQRNPKLAVYARPYVFNGKSEEYCVVHAGITHSTIDPTMNPRGPSFSWYSGASSLLAPQKDAPSGCVKRALQRALDGLASSMDENGMAKFLKNTVASTDEGSIKRPKRVADAKLFSYAQFGMSDVGAQWVIKEMPSWLPYAFDHREVRHHWSYIHVDADGGNKICMAAHGLTTYSGEGRIDRVPVHENARAILFKPNQAPTDENCFSPLFSSLSQDATPDSPLVQKFLDQWAKMAEPGLKAPTRETVRLGYAAWQRAEAKKVAAEEARVRAQNRVTQANSCTTHCVNGDCVRQWPNGRKERFQAPRKFNPFNGQWEWDASGC